MKKRVILAAILAVTGTMARGAFAETGESLKVAIVDLQKAINETEAGKKAEKDLNAAMLEKQKKFEILKGELETLRKDFEKQRLVLSGKPLDEKRQVLQEKLIAVEKTGATYEQELNQQRAQTLQQILGGLQQTVRDVGKENGYDFIFERSQGGVLFSSSAEDITAQVIERFNKQKKR